MILLKGSTEPSSLGVVTNAEGLVRAVNHPGEMGPQWRLPIATQGLKGGILKGKIIQ